MEIRKATRKDLPEIMKLYESARAFMVETGNPRQWAARGWPPEELVERDIAQGKCHVCQEDAVLLAVFYYDFGPDIDPCYARIEDGAWGSGAPYGVVHRIAARAGSGAGKICINWAFRQSGHLRIDTHGDNTVMQRTLAKLGFSRRGIIYVEEDNDPRIAFDKIR